MTHIQPALFGAPQTQLTSDDYYTPAWVFERMGIEFDLDVCSQKARIGHHIPPESDETPLPATTGPTNQGERHE